MADDISEADLVRQAQAGKTAAYAILVRRWSPRIMAVCHARVGSANVAEDMTQETLLRAFRGLGTIREPQKFGAWVRGIANRTCLDWLKAKERTQLSFSALGGEPCVASGNGEFPDRSEELDRLIAAVESLPEKCREVLMLYYYNDLTYRELAEMLEISPATINKRLTEARTLLRQRLAVPRR